MRRASISTIGPYFATAMTVCMALSCPGYALSQKMQESHSVDRLQRLIGRTLADIRERYPNPREGSAAVREMSVQLELSRSESRRAPRKREHRPTQPTDAQPKAASTSRTPVSALSSQPRNKPAPSDRNLLERIELPANQAKRFTTDTTLLRGSTYRIVASGTFSAWGGEPVGIDAVYCDRPGRCSPPQAWQQLRIDGRGVNEIRKARGDPPLAYNPQHRYVFEIDGKGAPLQLHLWDAIEAGSAGGNSGAISVVLFGAATAPVLGSPRDGLTVSQGEQLIFFAQPSEQSCRTDCQARADCAGYTWVRPNGYGTGEPAVCYLMRSIERTTEHPCCITAIRSTGRIQQPEPEQLSAPNGRWRWRADCSGGVSEGEWMIIESSYEGPFNGHFEASDVHTGRLKGVSGDNGSAHGGVRFERYVAGRVQKWTGRYTDAARRRIEGRLTDPTHSDCSFMAGKCPPTGCATLAAEADPSESTTGPAPKRTETTLWHEPAQASSARNLWPARTILGLETRSGLPVTGVQPDSPAAAAGLQTGDIILAIEETPVITEEDLILYLSEYRRSGGVWINLLRDGTPLDLRLAVPNNYPRAAAP